MCNTEVLLQPTHLRRTSSNQGLPSLRRSLQNRSPGARSSHPQPPAAGRRQAQGRTGHTPGALATSSNSNCSIEATSEPERREGDPEGAVIRELRDLAPCSCPPRDGSSHPHLKETDSPTALGEEAGNPLNFLVGGRFPEAVGLQRPLGPLLLPSPSSPFPWPPSFQTLPEYFYYNCKSNGSSLH